MKKLILLIVVCMGMFTYNYTTNANVVLAAQSNHSSKIEKGNTKVANKERSSNKNKKTQNSFPYDLLKNIPTVIAVFSVLLTFSYYIYEALSLNDSEKKY